LCDAVIGHDEPECDGQAYLDWLHQINLFVQPLDDKNEWYRYHHLFREVLLRQLEQQLTKRERRQLHARAATWYAEKKLIDEAVRHSLIAGEVDQAVELVAGDRHVLIDKQQWRRLERRLSLIPDDLTENDPRLQIIRAWLLNVQGKWQDEIAVLGKIEALLNLTQLPPKNAVPIWGEVHLLRANILGWSYNGPVLLNHIEQALEMLPRQWGYAYSAACMIEGFGLLLTGNAEESEEQLQRALRDPSIGANPMHKSLLLFGLAGLHWLNLDLQDMHYVAQRYVEHGRTHDLPETIAVAQYYLGSIHYERNELDDAERYFRAAANTRVPVTLNFQVQGVCGLILTYLAMDKHEKINALLDNTRALLMELESFHLLEWLKAIQAEVDLRQTENARAYHWMDKYDPYPPIGVHLLYVPQLTWVKTLLTRGEISDFRKAEDFLGQFAGLAADSNITYLRLAMLPYQALLADALGKKDEAVEYLREAVQLAEPGGWLRPFVDSGSRTAVLLETLRDRDGAAKFIERILAAFPALIQDQTDVPQRNLLVESLTSRELEILQLVAKQLSNKEIAAQLFIAPGTVRQHLHRIYRKLGVNSRWQAVTMATELGLLN
jgi:LuxR family maltose regulon positive regulatory protein